MDGELGYVSDDMNAQQAVGISALQPKAVSVPIGGDTYQQQLAVGSVKHDLQNLHYGSRANV